jgi:hypothetical protein
MTEVLDSVTFTYQVRGAALTCFAGLTSDLFSSLPSERQDSILSALVSTKLPVGLDSFANGIPALYKDKYEIDFFALLRSLAKFCVIFCNDCE